MSSTIPSVDDYIDLLEKVLQLSEQRSFQLLLFLPVYSVMVTKTFIMI